MGCHGAMAQSLSDLMARLPERVAGFERRGPVQPDRTPGMIEGAIQSYGAPVATATVYLFKRRSEAVPDGPASRATQDELGDSIGGAMARLGMERGGGEIRFERERDTTLTVQGGPAVRCGLIRQKLGEGLQTDFVCVTGLAGRLLKFRITARYREQETPAMMTVVGHFIGGVVRSLAQRPGSI